jgi:hypothetical protein
MEPSLLLALGLLTADMSQTLDITRHSAQYRELNPILGQHPSQVKVVSYFTVSAASLIGLNYVLPVKYAHALNWTSATVEAGFVAHNAHLGIRFNF